MKLQSKKGSFFVPDEEFVLPEKWGIIGCKELKKYFHEIKIDHVLDGNYDNQVYYINDMDGKWDSELIAYKDGKTEIISFDQFKEHVLKDIPKCEKETPFSVACDIAKELEDESKQIIGYKLIKPEYKEAVSKLIGYESWFESYFDRNIKTYGYNFSSEKDSVPRKELEKSGVLDLWFEPVYDTSITLKSGVKLSEDDIAEVKNLLDIKKAKEILNNK